MDRASRRKEERRQRAASPGIIPLPHQPLLTRPLPVLLLLSLLATLIYSNTFSASFQFDDAPNIVENPKIRHLENFLDLSGSRYVGFLSFALNYHFGGLHVFGYHLVNLLIHIINGFLVYSLVLLLFRTSVILPSPSNPQHLSSNISPLSPWVALSTALLFIVHPLQTQAVTYIVQRFASLAALFYLLAVVCYLKWRLASLTTHDSQLSTLNSLWYAGALLSTILAMKTKENSFTLPFMILLVEVVFFRPFQLSTLNSQLRLVPFLLTLPLIPLSHPGAIDEAEAGLAQETTEISRGDYLLTQFRVIVTYIRLLFLPIHQNLDYDYPVSHSLFDPPVFFSSLFLGALFGLALYLLFRSQLSTFNSQLISFGILWFFLTLSVESSIIPIRDVIFEHRVYLPSIGFLLALSSVLLPNRVERKRITPVWKIAGFLAVTLSFAIATYHRNLVWKDDLTLWQDVVNKVPRKARGHSNLGLAYSHQGRLEEAIREYQIALSLKPNLVEAHNSLGNAYKGQGRLEEAIQEYRTALKLQPDYAPSHYNLGAVYKDQGRLEEAIREYQTALRLQPDYAPSHYNLGIAYKDQGRLEEAIREYQTALRLQPNLSEAHYNLGAVYKDQGRLEEAIQEYRTALKLQPDYADAHNNLGIAYKGQGRLEEAIREYQTALQLEPDYAGFHNNLAITYGELGRFEDAIREYQAALKLQPNLAEAHYNLGALYKDLGRFNEAASSFKRALQIKPDFPQARQALDSLPH